MCYVMYIASDSRLPMIPFDEFSPGFCVEPLEEEEDVVRKHFSRPYVYRVGAHTCCACGFQLHNGCSSEDAEAVAGSRSALLLYLQKALENRSAVELFVCWYDSLETSPARRETVTPERLIAADGLLSSVHAEAAAGEFYVVAAE